MVSNRMPKLAENSSDRVQEADAPVENTVPNSQREREELVDAVQYALQ